MKRKGFCELIVRRQKIGKGGKREMRTRFFGVVPEIKLKAQSIMSGIRNLRNVLF
jgi:hypothetical protein